MEKPDKPVGVDLCDGDLLQLTNTQIIGRTWSLSIRVNLLGR